MTPILSAFGEQEKSDLNLLMPLSGRRYNRSADVGKREPRSSNTGLNRTHHGWARLKNTDTINPVCPHTHIYGQLVGRIKDHISLRDAKTNKPE